MQKILQIKQPYRSIVPVLQQPNGVFQNDKSLFKNNYVFRCDSAVVEV